MTELIDTVQLSEIDDELIELFDITLPGYSSTSGAGKIYLCNGENRSKIMMVTLILFLMGIHI